MAPLYLRVGLRSSRQSDKRIAQQVLRQAHYLGNNTPSHAYEEDLKSSSSQADRSIIDRPSTDQVRAIMMQSTLPMVGFGFMDQTIMIHAGNAVDCTIGVSLGLSTLSAAAVGQIVANTGALFFGESVQRFFSRFHAMKPVKLSVAQQSH